MTSDLPRFKYFLLALIITILIGCGSRSEEGPGFACEKTLLSVLDKRGCLQGSRDAGVLLLQAESTSVVCIVAAASSLDFEVFFFGCSR
jgi:hypothetical protein